jgi:hypothetical protein
MLHRGKASCKTASWSGPADRDPMKYPTDKIRELDKRHAA